MLSGGCGVSWVDACCRDVCVLVWLVNLCHKSLAVLANRAQNYNNVSVNIWELGMCLDAFGCSVCVFGYTSSVLHAVGSMVVG